eukprot:CAMPEP_0115472238 /NCGR_PEP_ID=MMETSP0271-20121206/52941_1 /TAXON_ID=71861 /ORGANISM="Scrippsiella trochoidea, Strain CCMP3099" /LENGTH=453 /DNA_ID=CAMNT_0002899459 /DNA_START=41 /DNA_END=1399 /DNA_ORIENTATION=-
MEVTAQSSCGSVVAAQSSCGSSTPFLGRHGSGNHEGQAGEEPGSPDSWGGNRNGSSSMGLLQRRAIKGTPVRWAVPALAMFVGLFIQTAGLYLGTRCYVRWMDEQHQPSYWGQHGLSGVAENDGAPSGDSTEHDAARNVESSVIDDLTMCIPIIWLGWVTRTRDLHRWTQLLISGALLAALKGFLAWATVMPDPEGWEACQARLGPDGLKYYRRQAGISLDKRQIDISEMFLDMLLLVMRGLWLSGQEQRACFCADTMFCSTTSLYALLCASLYQAVESSVWHFEARSQFIALTITRVLLGSAVAITSILPVFRSRHYVADVVLALALALLVYSNPVVTLTVERWLQGAWSQSGEVGEIVIPPCSAPGAGLDSRYYLRDELVYLECSSTELWKKQLKALRKIQDNLRQRVRRAESSLSKARMDVCLRAEERQEAADARFKAATEERTKHYAEE